MSTTLERIKRWFGRAGNPVEEEVHGGSPVATPAPGAYRAGLGDDERETSTNAQVEGAADQPWPGNS